MVRQSTSLSEPTSEHTEEIASPALDALLSRGTIDLDLAQRVERALRATTYGELRAVRVSVHAGVVVLEGRVSRYYLKQVAQTIALAVPGAKVIRNDLEVGQPTEGSSLGDRQPPGRG